MKCKYIDVINRIKEGIYTGIYKPGVKLPSILSLSRELGYNRETIIKAYKLLEDEHLIYAKPQSGYYVVKSTIAIKKSSDTVDMVTVGPPDDINPYKDFYHCMEKAIMIYQKKLFEYSNPKGLPELLSALTSHMMNFQIFTKPENIFITNGAQQALYILASIPFPNKQAKVLVEQPTYAIMLDVLNCNHIPAMGISRTKEGIDLNELENKFKNEGIKFFYIIPRFHNPTGYCYNTYQKKEIINLAKKYNVYIVEDDYVADLELNSKSDPMFAMGEENRIIYIRSFSKTLLPGLRLGMTILPKELHEEFLFYKKSMDLSTSTLNQGALEIYLQSRMYENHVQRIKQYYKNKMDFLRNLCIDEFRNMNHVECNIPNTGIYASIEFKNKSADRLVHRLLDQNMMLSSIGNCYLPGVHHKQGVRLSVCRTNEQDIVRVINALKRELERG